MTRDRALELVGEVYAVEDPRVIDLCIKRLGLNQEQFNDILRAPSKTFRDYPNLLGFLRRISFLVKILAVANIIPRSTYVKYCTGVI